MVDRYGNVLKYSFSCIIVNYMGKKQFLKTVLTNSVSEYYLTYENKKFTLEAKYSSMTPRDAYEQPCQLIRAVGRDRTKPPLVCWALITRVRSSRL